MGQKYDKFEEEYKKLLGKIESDIKKSLDEFNSVRTKAISISTPYDLPWPNSKEYGGPYISPKTIGDLVGLIYNNPEGLGNTKLEIGDSVFRFVYPFNAENEFIELTEEVYDGDVGAYTKKIKKIPSTIQKLFDKDLVKYESSLYENWIILSKSYNYFFKSVSKYKPNGWFITFM